MSEDVGTSGASLGDRAGPALHFEVVSIFPDLFDSFLAGSLLGKALAAGLVRVDRTNPRTFGVGRHKSVDDSPYGGGPGMVMRPEPLAAAIEHIEAMRGPCHRVLLSPGGRLLDQRIASELSKRGRVLLLCGRYEGIDERIATLFANDVLSIGDYVLAGGEVAAQVIIEATSRLVPGVIGKSESIVEESHASGLLEYPHYTRPPEFRGLGVPDVLLSGDHQAVAAWRRFQAVERTRLRRPDLLAQAPSVQAGQVPLVEATREPTSTSEAPRGGQGERR